MGLYSQQFDDRRTSGSAPTPASSGVTASSPAARQVGPSRRIDMAPTGQRMLPSESRGSGASIQYRNLKRLVADRLQPGKTYTADFIKRTTGGRRRMRFRTDIPSRFRGQRPRTWNPARYNLRNVLDVDRDEPRMLNLDALIRVQPEDDGVEYRRWRGARVNLPRDQREYTKTPTERQYYPFGFKPDDDPAAPPMPEYRTEEGRRALAQQLGQFDEPRMSAQLFAIRPQTGRRQYIQQLRDYLSGAEKHPPADQEDTQAVAEDMAASKQWPRKMRHSDAVDSARGWLNELSRQRDQSDADLRADFEKWGIKGVDDDRLSAERQNTRQATRLAMKDELAQRKRPDVRKDPRGGIEFDPDEMGDGDATDEERRMIVGGDVMDRRISAVGGHGDQPHHAKARAAVMRGGELQDYELEREKVENWDSDPIETPSQSINRLHMKTGDTARETINRLQDEGRITPDDALRMLAEARDSRISSPLAVLTHDPMYRAGVTKLAGGPSSRTRVKPPGMPGRSQPDPTPSRAAYTREDMDTMNRLADEDDQSFAARPLQQRSLLQAGRYAPGQFAPSGMADRQAQSMGVGLQRFSNGAVPASWSRLADTASHYNPLKTYSVARKAGHGRIKSALISGAAHGSDMFNPLAGPENARRVRGELQDDQQFATEDQAALGQLPQGLLDALRYVQVPAIGMSPTGAVMPPMAPMQQFKRDEDHKREMAKAAYSRTEIAGDPIQGRQYIENQRTFHPRSTRVVESSGAGDLHDRALQISKSEDEGFNPIVVNDSAGTARLGNLYRSMRQGSAHPVDVAADEGGQMDSGDDAAFNPVTVEERESPEQEGRRKWMRAFKIANYRAPLPQNIDDSKYEPAPELGYLDLPRWGRDDDDQRFAVGQRERSKSMFPDPTGDVNIGPRDMQERASRAMGKSRDLRLAQEAPQPWERGRQLATPVAKAIRQDERASAMERKSNRTMEQQGNRLNNVVAKARSKAQRAAMPADAEAGYQKKFGNAYRGNMNLAAMKDLAEIKSDPRYARNIDTSGLELDPEPFPRKMRAMRPSGSTVSDVHRSLGIDGSSHSIGGMRPGRRAPQSDYSRDAYGNHVGRGMMAAPPRATPRQQTAARPSPGRLDTRGLSPMYRGMRINRMLGRGARRPGLGQRLGGFVQGIANGMNNFRNDFRRGVKRSALSNRQMRRRQPFSAMPQDQDFSGGIASPWIRRGIETAQAIGGAFDPRATYRTLRSKGYGPRTSGGIAGVAHTLDATVIPGPLMSTLAKRLPARRSA